MINRFEVESDRGQFQKFAKLRLARVPWVRIPPSPPERGEVMEEEKKLALLVKPAEVICAELRMAIPGVLRQVEKLEEAKKINSEVWDWTFGRMTCSG